MLHHVRDLIEGLFIAGLVTGVVLDEIISFPVRRIHRHIKARKSQ